MKPPRWFLAVLLTAWSAFAIWCVWGFPPCVDLPGDGAQLETLVQLLRGNPAVSQVYEIKIPQGYGLTYWLFLPLAFLTNGAVAARVAMACALVLYPISILALLRAFKRSDWAVLLGLPLAFNISYWYGYLPNLFAQPLGFFTLACFAKVLEDRRARWLVLMNVLAAATLFCHLLVFAATAGLLGVLALTSRERWDALRRLAIGLGLSALISLPKVWEMATRAVTHGEWAPTDYAALSHLNWFFRNYRPEGYLAAVLPLLVTAVFLVAYLRRRKAEPFAPFALFAAMSLLYLVTPKTLSGIYLISVRLPVMAGVLALLLVDWTALAKPLRWGLVALSVLSLGESAAFHWRFARAVDGLAEVIDDQQPRRHGYLSLAGREILGSRNIYLEHLGQWLTATRGGVGHNFFADAEHHPVRFRPGQEIPANLREATPEQMARFDEVLVFGDGPLPRFLEHWPEVKRVGPWRQLVRP